MSQITEKRILLALILVFCGLIFLELPGSYLFEPDEARYAEVPREMLASKDFVTPRQNGSVYLEKPPLLYWLNAGSMALFGENPYTARLPSRLATLGIVLLLMFGVGSVSNPNSGFWAALIFLSNPMTMAMSRLNLTDGLLTFSLTLTFFSLKSFLIPQEDEFPRIFGRPTLISQIGLGVGGAMAVLTKGLIGVAFPGAILFLWCAWFRSWKPFRRILFSWAVPVFILLSVPWFILVQKANPEFFNFFFIREHFQRFATDVAKRPGPIYYFIPHILWGFLPWTIFMVGPLKKGLTDLLRKIPSEVPFFALWACFIFIFFSFSKSKLIPYIFPIWPAASALLVPDLLKDPDKKRPFFLGYAIFISIVGPLALYFGILEGVLHDSLLTEETFEVLSCFFLGGWVAFFLSKRFPRAALITLVVSMIFGFVELIINVPLFASDYSSKILAEKAMLLKPQTIVSFRCYPESLPFILKRPIPTVAFKGELASIGKLDPELFWKKKKFWARWKSKEKMAVIAPKNDLWEIQHFSINKKVPRIIDANRRYVLVANFPAD